MSGIFQLLYFAKSDILSFILFINKSDVLTPVLLIQNIGDKIRGHGVSLCQLTIVTKNSCNKWKVMYNNKKGDTCYGEKG